MARRSSKTRQVWSRMAKFSKLSLGRLGQRRYIRIHMLVDWVFLEPAYGQARSLDQQLMTPHYGVLAAASRGQIAESPLEVSDKEGICMHMLVDYGQLMTCL